MGQLAVTPREWETTRAGRGRSAFSMIFTLGRTVRPGADAGSGARGGVCPTGRGAPRQSG